MKHSLDIFFLTCQRNANTVGCLSQSAESCNMNKNVIRMNLLLTKIKIAAIINGLARYADGEEGESELKNTWKQSTELIIYF
jgi:hypothetical protein